eukprot:c3309_g1_i1.p1 GENE.c3309_g1_i1~~c3309_g1_i1.p1  ORF type:complete len:100 (-),score=12.39 c3309_g1_i1:140-439(-)
MRQRGTQNKAEEKSEPTPSDKQKEEQEQMELLEAKKYHFKRQVIRCVLTLIIFLILHQLFLRYVLTPYLHGEFSSTKGGIQIVTNKDAQKNDPLTKHRF